MIRFIPFMTVIHNSSYLMIRDVPVSSCILQCPDDVIVLIDTGMTGNEQLLDELEEIGIRANDVTMVINTHLHVDHAGNNVWFPHARILVSRQEWKWQSDLEKQLQVSQDPLRLLQELGRPVDEMFRPMADEMQGLAQDYPLLHRVGDPAQIEWIEDNPCLPDGIGLVHVPGHTPGSLAVQVNASNAVLIAGDALYHRDLWKTDALCALHTDQHLFQQTARSLIGFPGIIVPGHDRPFDQNGYCSVDMW